MQLQTDNHFIERFKEELNKVNNKEFLIQNEITQIEIFTSKRDSLQVTGLLSMGQYDNRTNSVFDLSHFGSVNLINDVFHEYVLHDKLIKFNEKNFSYNEGFIKTAKLFAEYYKWLKNLKSKPNSAIKFSELNNDQKILALHYLGFNFRDYSKNQMAFVLSQILNIGSENIRKNLSDLFKKDSELRTIENLEKLIELFDNKTFESITNKIEKEIKQMS